MPRRRPGQSRAGHAALPAAPRRRPPDPPGRALHLRIDAAWPWRDNGQLTRRVGVLLDEPYTARGKPLDYTWWRRKVWLPSLDAAIYAQATTEGDAEAAERLVTGSLAEAPGPVADLSYTGQVSTTDQGDRLVLTGPLARWITERATAEGRTEADVVAEALAVRWGAQLGDAYRDVWEASEGIDEAAADKLVDDEVYRPRQERRRAG